VLENKKRARALKGRRVVVDLRRHSKTAIEQFWQEKAW
jgi:hypothetical protein